LRFEDDSGGLDAGEIGQWLNSTQMYRGGSQFDGKESTENRVPENARLKITIREVRKCRRGKQESSAKLTNQRVSYVFLHCHSH